MPFTFFPGATMAKMESNQALDELNKAMTEYDRTVKERKRHDILRRELREKWIHAAKAEEAALIIVGYASTVDDNSRAAAQLLHKETKKWVRNQLCDAVNSDLTGLEMADAEEAALVKLKRIESAIRDIEAIELTDSE